MKLKVYFCSFLLFFGLQAGFVSGKENPDTETDIETNILIFGNSACHGFIDYLPKMYEADGMRLNLRCLRSSAAGFVRAIDAVESGRATGEPLPAELPEKKKIMDYGYVALETDYDAKVFLLDEIRSRDWHIVILAGNTGLAATGENVKFFTRASGFVRKYLPDTRIIFFQNFAVRNDSQTWILRSERTLRKRGVLKKDEILTEDLFCWLSSRDYTVAAEKNKASLIPGGDLLYWIRYDPRWAYKSFPDHVRAKKTYDEMKPPDTPDQSRCLRRGFHWKPDGKSWGVDHHLNAQGNFLVAAAAYEILLNRDVRKNRFQPGDRITEKDAQLLRELVHEFVNDNKRIPVFRNVPMPQAPDAQGEE